MNGDEVQIPDILKDCRFIIVRKKEKAAREKEWQLENNYSIDDPKLIHALKTGYNYGVMPSGNVGILDADEPDILQELGLLEQFNDTFTVKSGGGEKYHYYFETDEGIGNKKIVLSHPKTEEHLGELYPPGCPAYCVGAGSVHPSGKPYSIFKDLPLKFIPSKDISKIIARCTKQEEKPKRDPIDWSKYEGSRDTLTDKAGLRIEDIAHLVNGVDRGNGEIQGAHPIHGSTTGMNFSINPSKNLWHCYRHDTGGDPALFIAVKEGLISCEDAGTGALTDSDTLKKLEEVILSGKYGKGYADKLQQANEEEKKQYINEQEEIKRIKRRSRSISEEEFKECDDRPDIKELRFKINVPDDHFISRYVSHHVNKTDAYPDYHYAAALTLLSIAADRKVIIPIKNTGDIYTNLWIMNLGRSSFSRKSTALNSVKYIAGANTAYHSLPGMFSTEGLIEEFSDNPRGYLIKDECAQILGSINKKQYMSDVRDVLCELYDCGNIKRKLRTSKKNARSEYEIKDSYPVFIMATTPDNFFNNSTHLDVTSGWLIRFLYVYPRYKKGIKGLEIGTEQDRTELNELGNHFNNIAGCVSVFDQVIMKPSQKALENFNNWFITKQNEYEDSEEDLSLHSSVLSRILVTALKIAALLTLGDKSCKDEFAAHGVSWNVKFQDVKQNHQLHPEIPIPDKYMIEAVRLVDAYFLPIACDIIDDVTARENENIQGKIIQFLKNAPKCKLTRSEILRKMKMKSKDLEEHLDTLIEADVIDIYIDKTSAKDKTSFLLKTGKKPNKSIFDF